MRRVGLALAVLLAVAGARSAGAAPPSDAWLEGYAAAVLERARVALNDGALFGPGGQGFVRLNFGCPRALLTEGLERMRKALA